MSQGEVILSALGALVLGPFLTAAFSVIILLWKPWLIPLLVLPWALIAGPALRLRRRHGGFRGVIRARNARPVLITWAVALGMAQLVPVGAFTVGRLVGKTASPQTASPWWFIIEDLSYGTCMSSMMLLTGLMALLIGLCYRSTLLRHAIVIVCAAAAISLEFHFVYLNVGSTDGQAALVFPVSPIYGHLAASAIASVFAVFPFWKWCRLRARARAVRQSAAA